MHFSSYLDTDRIKLLASISSKKKTLELLAGLLASQNDALDAQRIFNQLVEREQMGSTAIGHGTAIPHCRLAGLDAPLAALLRVDAGVHYDATDGLPVRLLFALLVPENATGQHLDLLAGLATQLNEPMFVQRLLKANGAQQVLDLLKCEAQPR